MGAMPFLKEAILRFSRNPEKYRNLIIKYQDRIFFGTDLVATNAAYKTVDWIDKVTRVYRDILEKENYRFFGLEERELRGFNLDASVLEKIYRLNF
jgi:hypothetical protein